MKRLGLICLIGSMMMGNVMGLNLSRKESWNYSVENNEISVIGLSDKDYAGFLLVPSNFDYPITAISENGFANHTHITSCTLPETLVSIGANAFTGCTALKQFHFYGPPPTVDEPCVFPDAVATYDAKYAEQWRAALDADGKWHNLTMKQLRMLTVATEGDGRVTLRGDARYTAGDVLSFYIEPGVNSFFWGWKHDPTVYRQANPGVYSVEMPDEEIVLTAVFKAYYPVSIHTVGNGCVECENEVYAQGELVRLIAMPNEGSLFCGWEGPIASDSNVIMCEMPNGSLSVTAYFAEIDALDHYIQLNHCVQADNIATEISNAIQMRNVYTVEQMQDLYPGDMFLEVHEHSLPLELKLKRSDTLSGEWSDVSFEEISLVNAHDAFVLTLPLERDQAFYKLSLVEEENHCSVDAVTTSTESESSEANIIRHDSENGTL